VAPHLAHFPRGPSDFFLFFSHFARPSINGLLDPSPALFQTNHVNCSPQFPESSNIPQANLFPLNNWQTCFLCFLIPSSTQLLWYVGMLDCVRTHCFSALSTSSRCYFFFFCGFKSPLLENLGSHPTMIHRLYVPSQDRFSRHFSMIFGILSFSPPQVHVFV